MLFKEEDKYERVHKKKMALEKGFQKERKTRMRKRQRGKSCALKMMEKADKNMTENMKWGMLGQGWAGRGRG